MTPYSYFAEKAVQETFVTAAPRDQRILLDSFSLLASHPFRAPDWIEYDTDNRPLSVCLHEDWLISYWVDHAVRTVMIVQATLVEGA